MAQISPDQNLLFVRPIDQDMGDGDKVFQGAFVNKELKKLMNLFAISLPLPTSFLHESLLPAPLSHTSLGIGVVISGLRFSFFVNEDFVKVEILFGVFPASLIKSFQHASHVCSFGNLALLVKPHESPHPALSHTFLSTGVDT